MRNLGETWAGSPQGLLPGAPTDPDVRVKRIRFVTVWKIAVPRTTRSFRGDTLVRHGVLGVVPTPRPQRGTPFAPQGPEGPFPRFNATMGHCDSLPSFSPRFVSCPSRLQGQFFVFLRGCRRPLSTTRSLTIWILSNGPDQLSPRNAYSQRIALLSGPIWDRVNRVAQACRLERIVPKARPPKWPYWRFYRSPLSMPLGTSLGAP